MGKERCQQRIVKDNDKRKGEGNGLERNELNTSLKMIASFQ